MTRNSWPDGHIIVDGIPVGPDDQFTVEMDHAPIRDQLNGVGVIAAMPQVKVTVNGKVLAGFDHVIRFIPRLIIEEDPF